MITHQEVMDFSREFGLAPNIVEKDYMLGWLLAGISHQESIHAGWAFKGGTCLKKCYFETYRFSEDLDFTITSPEHQNESFLIDAFKSISAWIYENAGIEIPSEAIRFEVIISRLGRTNIEGRIYYKGPLGFGGAHPRIKLDLTTEEVLVLDPVDCRVHHPYSDSPESGIHIRSYCFEEIFAEKLRALSERLRPRDLYDVIHLYRHGLKGQNRELILSTLKKKCEFKEISVPSLSMLEAKPERAELESEWEHMLGHQVPVLPPFSQYWEALPAVFEWLLQAAEVAAPAAIPNLGHEVDTTWHPPAMAQAWRTRAPIEIIRYAASTRLCVNLTYDGTDRLIEPYSLRRTRDGNLLLYAVKHATGENRSYRVDRIQDAKATNISFQPKYAIELAETS
jgi:predicted nucleotidyltransferase component of viral defense system